MALSVLENTTGISQQVVSYLWMVTLSDSHTWEFSLCFLQMLSYLLTWGPTSGLHGTVTCLSLNLDVLSCKFSEALFMWFLHC